MVRYNLPDYALLTIGQILQRIHKSRVNSFDVRSGHYNQFQPSLAKSMKNTSPQYKQPHIRVEVPLFMSQMVNESPGPGPFGPTQEP